MPLLGAVLACCEGVLSVKISKSAPMHLKLQILTYRKSWLHIIRLRIEDVCVPHE